MKTSPARTHRAEVIPFRRPDPPDPIPAHRLSELVRMAAFVLARADHRAARLAETICRLYYPAVTERN